MGFFISSLIRGMDHMEELAEWVNTQPIPELGVELIAFTHDDRYWRRLAGILNKIRCPATFHGPYIGVEATALPNTKEQEWLFESYERVMRLAHQHGVGHIVFHYTQKGFQEEEKTFYQQVSQSNIEILLGMAKQYQISLVIENLPFPQNAVPLYDNIEYGELFDRHQEALSMIDIGHAHMNHMDIEAYLKEHGDRVKAYHFHNNNGLEDQHNSVYDGTFSYEAFAGIYRHYTPCADIVLEYEPHTNLANRDIIEEINRLSKQFAKIRA